VKVFTPTTNALNSCLDLSKKLITAAHPPFHLRHLSLLYCTKHHDLIEFVLVVANAIPFPQQYSGFSATIPKESDCLPIFACHVPYFSISTLFSSPPPSTSTFSGHAFFLY